MNKIVKDILEQNLDSRKQRLEVISKSIDVLKKDLAYWIEEQLKCEESIKGIEEELNGAI